MPPRRPGRPSSAAITRVRILRTALELLEAQGLAAVSMRALARRLRVDPMALYHYFDDRDALLAAAAAEAYATLDERAGTRGTWQQRLVSLAEAYVGFLARSGELLRYLAAHDVASTVPVQLFGARFDSAVASLALSPSRRRTAHDAFVDLLHGFSLSVPRAGLTPALRRKLRQELALLFTGWSR